MAPSESLGFHNNQIVVKADSQARQGTRNSMESCDSQKMNHKPSDVLYDAVSKCAGEYRS